MQITVARVIPATTSHAYDSFVLHVYVYMYVQSSAAHMTLPLTPTAPLSVCVCVCSRFAAVNPRMMKCAPAFVAMSCVVTRAQVEEGNDTMMGTTAFDTEYFVVLLFVGLTMFGMMVATHLE